MGMTYRKAGALIAVIIVLVVVVLYGPTLYNRERMTGRLMRTPIKPPSTGGYPLNAPPIATARAKTKGRREKYGPPPGMARAISPDELPYLVGDRGWANWPRELEGNTASSVSHFIERSA
jgi:hypothetical protein